jgi:hypothetical protein
MLSGFPQYFEQIPDRTLRMFAVEWLAFRLRSRKVSGSILDPKTDYLSTFVSFLSHFRCWTCTLK